MKRKITKNQAKDFIKNDYVGALTHALTMAALINEDGVRGNEVSRGVVKLKGHQRYNQDVYIVMESKEALYLRDIGYLLNSLYKNCLKAHHKRVLNFFFIVKMEKVIRTIRIPTSVIVKYLESGMDNKKFVQNWRVKDIRRSRGSA
jgi:hypothetical protein